MRVNVSSRAPTIPAPGCDKGPWTRSWQELSVTSLGAARAAEKERSGARSGVRDSGLRVSSQCD